MCEATGAATVAFHALQFLTVNGVLVFTGVPGRGGRIDLEAGARMRDIKSAVSFAGTR